MRLSHNIPSLNIYTKYKVSLAEQAKAMKNISTGCKINSAADNPYGLAQNESFTMQIRGLQMANQNSQDSVSLIQTAEGGLSGMSSMLDRIKELTVQAGNGTNDPKDEAAIQTEIKQLVDGIDNFAKSTNINGVSPLCSDQTSSTIAGKDLNVMIGSNVGESFKIPTYNLQAANLKDASGNSLNSIDITTESGRSTAMNVVDAASKTISAVRSKYGAVENRLDTALTNSSEIGTEVQEADSNVMDADVATEMLNYSKSSILVQSGIAMMAQSNRFPQDVLQILKNIK